jgi:glycosyltransferase involved in cell wall biosynthesis
MLRILYCTDSLMSGGIERQITELITRLDRSRFEPEVICLYGERAGRSTHFVPRLLDVGVPVHLLDLGWSPGDKVRGWASIIRLTWRLRPHILHAYNYHSNLLTRLARPFLPYSVPLIGSMRGEYTSKQLLYERISQWACAVIVCNSPHLQRQLTETARIPEQKVRFIPNGVDTERFACNPNPALSAELRRDASRVLLMFGRISEQKSPHLLAQALGVLKQREQLLDIRVLIVGERESTDYQAKLDEAIQQYRLNRIVRQYEQTPQPEAFYHAADVVVLATLWEGMPNVALEALAAGRPVAISEAANAGGVIEHGVTGWVVRTGDVEHLAETLHEVLKLPGEALAAMRPACLRRAEDFAMTRMVERYQSLYERLRAMPSP